MLRFGDAIAPVLRAALGYVDAADAVLDPRGVTVRCTPTRRTVCLHVRAAGEAWCLFRKQRIGAVGAAEAEWDWLHALPRAGLPCCAPVCFARRGELTAVVTAAAPGRPLSALLREADPASAVAYATTTVVPMLRRMHAAGIVFRDAYWQHLFAERIEPGCEPTWIDVERALRPWLRRQRWIVKDLAGLVASWPTAVDVGEALVRAYAGASDPRLLAAVRRKAQRIRAHVPVFGA